MQNLLKLLLLSLVIAGPPACAAQSYEAFCQNARNEAVWTESYQEREFMMRDWRDQIRGLNAAKMLSPADKIHSLYISEPGVPLTNNALEDLANFLTALQLECSALWGIPLPPA